MRTTISAHALTTMLDHTEPHVHGRPELAAIRLEALGSHLYAVAVDECTMAVDRADSVNEGRWHAHLSHADIPLVRTWLGRVDSQADVRLGAAPSGAGTSITLRCGHAMLRVVNSIPEQGIPAWHELAAGPLAEVDAAPVLLFRPV
ncbi:hypothetical protein E6W39_24410 [Kitasatospora acidiphila]|uniref:Uncharacterized protein n=1 Tax=Kitasatospora acidiphila TaxID=2567942 RepID=A0A540W8U5_9ACTN|nr:hypothetical protein [Kitasatospora acidiphila]TQF04794.1 hypothetical protein E6W39_24410 [Kitasatospora acidiphila]